MIKSYYGKNSGKWTQLRALSDATYDVDLSTQDILIQHGQRNLFFRRANEASSEGWNCGVHNIHIYFYWLFEKIHVFWEISLNTNTCLYISIAMWNLTVILINPQPIITCLCSFTLDLKSEALWGIHQIQNQIFHWEECEYCTKHSACV